jgi:hypothetical protein
MLSAGLCCFGYPSALMTVLKCGGSYCNCPVLCNAALPQRYSSPNQDKPVQQSRTNLNASPCPITCTALLLTAPHLTSTKPPSSAGPMLSAW